jgi:hypothetical protein
MEAGEGEILLRMERGGEKDVGESYKGGDDMSFEPVWAPCVCNVNGRFLSEEELSGN